MPRATVAARTARHLLTRLTDAGTGGCKSLLLFARTDRAGRVENLRTVDAPGRGRERRRAAHAQRNDTEARCGRYVAAR